MRLRTSLAAIILVGCSLFGLACQPEEKKEEPKPAEKKKVAEKPCDPKDLKPVKPATPPETLELQHILITWKGAGAKNPKVTRSKGEAAKIWEQVYQEAMNCTDFNKLVIKYSDDPYKMNDSKYNAFPGFYEISPEGTFDKNFKACAQGMSPGNVDKVESYYGFHVIRRKS